MSVGYIFKKFRGIHGSCLLVHHHRVGGVTTSAAWVGLGAAFGNPSREAILSCGVPRTLNTIWYTTSKLKTIWEVASQELSVKYGKRDKESVSMGGFLPHKNPLCLIEGPSVFTKLRWTRMDLGCNYLGQEYNQPEQVMARMKNYATRPSALPFLTYIPEKIPWGVLWDSDSVHEVHPSAKVVPVEQRTRSLGTYIYIPLMEKPLLLSNRGLTRSMIQLSGHIYGIDCSLNYNLCCYPTR